MQRSILKLFCVFCFGAIAYGCVEIIERGRSHITMALLGGASMIVIHFLNDERRRGAFFLPLAILSALFITASEFLAGEILNIYLGLGIWSYSGMPFNIDGVICIHYTGYWLLLSAVGMFADEFLRHRLFGEKRIFFITGRIKARSV